MSLVILPLTVMLKACDLMLADLRQRGWSMFCCGRTPKRPSDHMQFHPPRQLVIPRACDLMLVDVRHRGWSMFCCGRTAKHPPAHHKRHFPPPPPPPTSTSYTLFLHV